MLRVTESSRHPRLCLGSSLLPRAHSQITPCYRGHHKSEPEPANAQKIKPLAPSSCQDNPGQKRVGCLQHGDGKLPTTPALPAKPGVFCRQWDKQCPIDPSNPGYLRPNAGGSSLRIQFNHSRLQSITVSLVPEHLTKHTGSTESRRAQSRHSAVQRAAIQRGASSEASASSYISKSTILMAGSLTSP